MNPIALLWVFFGGGIGASLRYIIVNLIGKAGSVPAFPFSILLINIAGSFAIGALSQIVSRETFANFTYISPFLLAGVLGGFTTFSAFSLEAVALFQAGRVAAALAYIICSVVFSILAAYLGYIISK